MAKWWCLFLLGVAPVVFGQQTELDRLVAESIRLRELTPVGQYSQDPFGKVTRPDWTNLKHFLRDWIESRLPANLAALDREYQGLGAQLTAELWRAGLTEPEKPSAEAGYVSSVNLSRPMEYPGVLMVEAGVTVPCGFDVSIYIYHYKTDSRIRLLEADGNGKWGNQVAETLFSAPDTLGRRAFYASWSGVQCASVWNMLDYRLFRIDADGDHVAPILAETHSYADWDAQVKLTPEELLLELSAEAMEGGFRRTYIMHYSLGSDGVQRIDPVAPTAPGFYP
ncbi:MAG: hypothetical protein ABSG65_23715 [Bryobacteraceae bacterium]|jgi:hypothetical protein